MNGGYLMVSKADTKIYDKLQLGLKVGKPILWYESETVCYYIDTISGGEITTEIVDDEEVITYGDIILTKGGKTITITSANAVTETGDIQNHLYNFYLPSIYLQTTDYGDIRGMWEFTAVDDDYNINAYDFVTIKDGLIKILDKCGIIKITNSDSDSTFTGFIYKENNDIFIEGYSSDKEDYIKVNLNSLSNDTDLELIADWDKCQLF